MKILDKEKIKDILGRIDFWMNEDKKIQNALNILIKLIAPSSYVPIIETSLTQSFIDGICFVNPELKEEFEYYAYELSGMEKAEGNRDGKKYNLKNIDEYIDFICV